MWPKTKANALRYVAVVGVLLFSIAAMAGEPKNPTLLASNWAPPDVDSAIPPTNTGPACAGDAVVSAATRQVDQSVVDMQQFSALERVEFNEVDRNGNPHEWAHGKFTYVAYIHEVRPGVLTVDEFRNDSLAEETLANNIATRGTVAFFLVFHKNYVNDFEFTCEGQTTVAGKPAWQVRFRQKVANNFRQYRRANQLFRILLKGRAWLDASTYDVLRIETDLAQTVPDLSLWREHVAIEYGAVDFPRRAVRLWLPYSADIYMDYRGRRFHHRHSFSEFQLFWVETEEKIGAVKKR